MNYIAGESADQIEIVHAGEPEALEVHSQGPQGRAGDAPGDGRWVTTRRFNVTWLSPSLAEQFSLPVGAVIRWVDLEISTPFSSGDHNVSIMGPGGMVLSLSGAALQQPAGTQFSCSPLPSAAGGPVSAAHSGSSNAGSVRVSVEYALP